MPLENCFLNQEFCFQKERKRTDEDDNANNYVM